MKKQRIIISTLMLILFVVIGISYLALGFETRQAVNISSGSEVIDYIIGGLLIVGGIALFFLFLFTDTLKHIRKYGKKYWYFFLLFDISKWILLIILAVIILKGGFNLSQSFVG